jgi:hypothetical protein
MRVPSLGESDFDEIVKGLKNIAPELRMSERQLGRLIADPQVRAMFTIRGARYSITRLALAFLALGIENRTAEARRRTNPRGTDGRWSIGE